mmetsp:Transcript_30285/g.74440  ORF Transcript_30285/g.74440 Transcript_30285/m.74440 type:complete len:230 (+) Transcript_30285:1340-2029(+)
MIPVASLLPVMLASAIVARASSTSCSSPEPVRVRTLLRMSMMGCSRMKASRTVSDRDMLAKAPIARACISPLVAASAHSASSNPLCRATFALDCLSAFTKLSVRVLRPKRDPIEHTFATAPAAAAFSSSVPVFIMAVRASRISLYSETTTQLSTFPKQTNPSARQPHKMLLLSGCLVPCVRSPSNASHRPCTCPSLALFVSTLSFPTINTSQKSATVLAAFSAAFESSL